MFIVSGQKDINEDSPIKGNRGTEAPKAVMQIGTQTSPEGASSLKGHFSIGFVTKEEKLSPKFMKKDRSLGRSSKRAMSPAPQVWI